MDQECRSCQEISCGENQSIVRCQKEDIRQVSVPLCKGVESPLEVISHLLLAACSRGQHVTIKISEHVHNLNQRRCKHFGDENGIHGRDQGIRVIVQSIFERCNIGSQQRGDNPKEGSIFEVERNLTTSFVGMGLEWDNTILANVWSTGCHELQNRKNVR